MIAVPVLTTRDPEFYNPDVSLMTTDVRNIVMMVSSTIGMIAAAKFDWVEDDVDDTTYPTGPHGRRQVLLGIVAFKYNVDSDVALKRIAENGWEVARAEHLLAFARRFKEEQRKHRIVALGSSWEIEPGRRDVLVLEGGEHDRGLARHNIDGIWYEGEDLFLVYRKA